MSGLLTTNSSSVLLLLSLSLALLLLPPLTLDAKSLSAAPGVGGRGLDATGGGVRRLRRDLRDSLPYEAGMMSYPGESADVLTRRGGNELLYQPEEWRGQGLSHAVQQLVENDERHEQDAAYLAGLLRLLSEAEGTAGEDGGVEDQGPADFQGHYTRDYDETEQGMRMGKPQAAAPWQGLLDPQLTQALLNRYRQERLQQQQAGLPGLPTAINRLANSRLETGSQDRDEEALRYLVAKVLSNISPTKPQGSSGRRARRDLVSASGDGGRVRASSSPVLHRSRRSLDSPPSPSLNREHSVGLLRVKRLGDMEGMVVEGPCGPGEEVEGHRTPDHMVELQRMKKIDNELQPQPGGRPSRRRRALNYDPITYDPELLVQHILHYLPQ